MPTVGNDDFTTKQINKTKVETVFLLILVAKVNNVCLYLIVSKWSALLAYPYYQYYPN